MITTSTTPFERSSKRRKGFPSETQVKRGLQFVRGNKDLYEKLGRNDLCPCGSGRRFQTLLPRVRQIRRNATQLLLSVCNRTSDGVCDDNEGQPVPVAMSVADKSVDACRFSHLHIHLLFAYSKLMFDEV
jgi:SEC-C motif